MKHYLLIGFLSMLLSFSYGQRFTGGVQYGLAINTLYKFTDDLSYFDALNYGKKLTGTVGIFTNCNLNKHMQIETGLFYSKRGTRYGVAYSYNTTGRRTNISCVDIYYIGFPVIMNQVSQQNKLFSYRYGIDIAYNFYTNFPTIDGPTEFIYNEFDVEGVFGIKMNLKDLSFFKNNHLIIDLRGSFLPIVNKNNEYLLNTSSIFKVLPTQRNFSLTFSMQHEF